MPRVSRPARLLPRRARRIASLVGVMAALGASLIAGPAAQASVPALAGYRDFGFGGAQATRATSDPEQSKLWYADGSWWAGLFVSSGRGSGGSHFNIFWFNPDTHAWVDTTRQIDSRDHSHADYFFDAAHNKLYVASSKSICDKKFDGAQPCNDSIRVYRFSFNAAATSLSLKYTLDTGFPKILAGGGYTGGNFTGGGSNAITITRDSTGEVWVTYTRDDPTTAAPPITDSHTNVWLAHTVSDGDAATFADETTWIGPGHFVAATAGQLNQDNTASVIAFGGNKVGVYWTDKHASGASSAFFAVHNDGDSAATWATETVTSSTNAIDNQVNLKTDSAGKVYAIAKTEVSDQVRLFDRATDGTWSSHNVWTSGNGNTRPQVVIDEELGLAYAFSSSGSTTDGTIYVKSATLATLSFPTGKGTPFIKSSIDHAIDDVTLTKQTVDHTTGILGEASDRVTFEFLHGEMTLAATDVTPPSGSVTIAGGAAFTATRNVVLTVPATDAGSGVSLVRVANDSNSTDGSGQLDDASAVTSTWTGSVDWALANVDGLRTVWVQFRDSKGNWSTPVSDTITLDTTGPTGTVTINGGAGTTNNPDVTLAVPATDAGVGTVTNVRIANAGDTSAGVLSDASAVTRPYAASQPWRLAPGADGSRSVYVQWQDSLGNWSGVVNDTINLADTVPPVGHVAINGTTDTGVHSLTVTLQFPSTDDDVDRITISNSSTMSSPTIVGTLGTPFTGTVPWTLPGPLTNGSVKHVYVTFHDIAGNTSAPAGVGLAYSASDTATVDLTKPVTKGPVKTSWASSVTLSSSYLPLRITWPAGTDTITGVGSYRVYLSRDGGTFTFAGTSTVLSKTVPAAANHTYKAKVYAVDRAGNLSGSPVYSAAVRVLAYQDTNAAVKFTTGGWASASNSLFYGGTVRYSNTRGKAASLTFSGKSVSWLSVLGPTRGSARVYIDGALAATVNLNAATSTTKRVVFARNFSSVGTHSIRITVLGTAGHPRVEVDAFLVLR